MLAWHRYRFAGTLQERYMQSVRARCCWSARLGQDEATGDEKR